MMTIPSVSYLSMKGNRRIVNQGLEKFSNQFCIETSDLPLPQGEMKDQKRASGKVNMNGSQAFIHGNEGRSISSNPFFLTQRLLQGAPHTDSHIFHGVVTIDCGVPFGLNRQIQETMGRKQGEHMIQNRNRG